MGTINSIHSTLAPLHILLSVSETGGTSLQTPHPNTTKSRSSSVKENCVAPLHQAQGCHEENSNLFIQYIEHCEAVLWVNNGAHSKLLHTEGLCLRFSPLSESRPWLQTAAFFFGCPSRHTETDCFSSH